MRGLNARFRWPRTTCAPEWHGGKKGAVAALCWRRDGAAGWVGTSVWDGGTAQW